MTISKIRDFRGEVVSFLRLLVASDKSHDIDLPVPHSELPYHLCRLWFDEIYLPSEQYIDCIKGDHSDDAITRFCEAFDEEQLDALEQFHRFLELRVAMLERSGQQLKEIGASQFWFHTRKDAAHALETFEIDMKQLESWRTELIARLERAAPNY